VIDDDIEVVMNTFSQHVLRKKPLDVRHTDYLNYV